MPVPALDKKKLTRGLRKVSVGSENLNTRPLVRNQVDFLADKLIF